MTFKEYQENIKTYDNYPIELGPYYLILSIYNDIGKLSEKLQNSLNNGEANFSNEEKLKLSINIGDTIYDLMTVCNSLNINIDDVIALNLRKLSMQHEQNQEQILNN